MSDGKGEESTSLYMYILARILDRNKQPGSEYKGQNYLLRNSKLHKKCTKSFRLLY